MGIETYRDLDIWKKGIEVVKDIYELTEKFPKQETYGISQPNETVGYFHTFECG